MKCVCGDDLPKGWKFCGERCERAFDAGRLSVLNPQRDGSLRRKIESVLDEMHVIPYGT